MLGDCVAPMQINPSRRCCGFRGLRYPWGKSVEIGCFWSSRGLGGFTGSRFLTASRSKSRSFTRWCCWGWWAPRKCSSNMVWLVWFFCILSAFKQTLGACPLDVVGPGWIWIWRAKSSCLVSVGVGSGLLDRLWRLMSRLALYTGYVYSDFFVFILTD